MVDPILILHLSDLHLGPKNRFGNRDLKELGKYFSSSILDECKKRSIKTKIDVVIVTGDIAEFAKPKEYLNAKILFEVLSKNLKVPHQKFIFLPGNHDVSWSVCERLESLYKERDWEESKLASRMQIMKFVNFDVFLRKFYGSEKEWPYKRLIGGGKLYRFDDLRLSVACLNSCEKESHREEDHLGALSVEQAQDLINTWETPELIQFLKIIAIHHNPTTPSPENVTKLINYLTTESKMDPGVALKYASDAVVFQGFDNLLKIANDCRVQLIVNGHQHGKGRNMQGWDNGIEGLTHIISAGSLGLLQNELPEDQRNNMQLILFDLDNNRIYAWALVYDPLVREHGSILPGKFITDSTEEKGYQHPLYLPDDFLIHKMTPNPTGANSRPKGDSSFDEKTGRANLTDIDDKALQDFMNENDLKMSILVDESLDNLLLKQALEKLKLMKSGNITNAAILLFGKNTQEFFLQAKTKCVKYEDINATNKIDSIIIEGTLLNQMKGTIEFIQKNCDINGACKYPIEALREAIANALAHRDYMSSGSNQINIFSNRIEIWSPGDLPKDVSIENIREPHISMPRNILIADIFNKAGLMDLFGTGIQRMCKRVREYSLPEPNFRFLSGCLVVIIEDSHK